MTGGSHSGAPTDLDPRWHDWRALIKRLPLAVYIDRFDEWSSNLYTSPQIEAILGYSPGEWTSDDHLSLRILHPEDRDRVMAAHRRSDEQRELAGSVRTSGDVLRGVTDDVLDFSKIEAGRLEIEQRPLVLRECVEGALELVAARADAKGLDGLLGRIDAENARVKRALQELT